MQERQRRQLLIGALAGALVLWFLPMARLLVLPFIYLNTHLHELAHGVMAILTGGRVLYIVVEATGGGYAVTQGGTPFLIASAGYTGSAMLGGAMILMARTDQGAKIALWSLAGLLTFGMVLYVRGDVVGVVSGLFWIGLTALLAHKLKPEPRIFAAQFLGAMQCLAAITAVRDLIWINANQFETRNDAVAVAQIAPFGAMFWAVLWLVFSLVVVVICLKVAWRGTSATSPAVNTWRSRP